MREILTIALIFLISMVFLVSCSDDDDDSSDSNQESDDDDSTVPDDDDTADDDFSDDDDNDDDDNDDNDDATDNLGYVPLKDEQGRTLILHGCAYMGMEFGGFYHSAEDFELIASWGFNVVRLPIAWSFLEPEEGVYDTSYLSDYVEPAVENAVNAGLKVYLDMHQWNWSPCSGGNGAPAWTCDTPTGGEYDWLRQSHLFWNHPEYLDHFVGAWELVAQYFAGDDRIWGYDIWNEPVAGLRSLPWFSENQLYRPLFIRFIEAIRAHHPEPYILIEPSMVHVNLTMPFVMDPLPYERQIYAPHLYPGGAASGGDFVLGIQNVRMHAKRMLDEANDHGIPMLISEVGIVSHAPHAEFYTRIANQVFDEYLAHFTWWTFWKGSNGFALLDSAGNEKSLYFPYLVRPYPQATAGHLRAFGYDPDTKDFSMQFDTDQDLDLDPHVEIWVPADRHYPDGFEVECSDEPGTWSFDFDETTSILTVNCDPGTLDHTIRIVTSEKK